MRIKSASNSHSNFYFWNDLSPQKGKNQKIKLEKQKKIFEDNIIMNVLLFEWQMAITFCRYHLNRMGDHPFSTYSKFYEKRNISYPLMRKKY